MINEYDLPDFKITSNGKISREFVNSNLTTFKESIAYIHALPYGRNSNKYDLTTVFSDQCGTCSTKHAVLKQLADENGFEGLHLVIGIFKMDEVFSGAIKDTLGKHKLKYIPEAHNYLKYKGKVFDFTKLGVDSGGPGDRIIEEIEIIPEQITDYKVAYHKKFLTEWLKNNPQIPYTLDELWNIKEQCIKDLAT
jgi:hypothetical protein